MRVKSLISVAAVLLMGCGTASIQPFSSVTYEPDRDLAVDTVAVLPIAAGEGLEGFRRITEESLASSLGEATAGLHVISAQTSLRRLNDAELAESYAAMLRNYQTTGILDQSTLEEMASAVGSRYLLLARVRYDEGAPDQEVSLFVHLWSPEPGDVVWESSAGAKIVNPDKKYLEEEGFRVRDIIFEACRELARRFPS